MALAGQVIASHYAEPAERVIASSTPLYLAASADSQVVATLDEGDRFSLLDDSLGWAWGYAGKDRMVGYVSAEALA